MAGKGELNFIDDFAAQIPVEVIGNLLAIPRAERAPLRGWSVAILSGLEPTLTPAMFGVGNRAVTEFIALLKVLIAERRKHPGVDMVITNDPYPSGVHLNDISLIAPVHHEGELLGYVANLAHHVDVGGGAPASIGAFREVFQEGVIIPPVKVVAGGRIVDDVF